MRVRTDDGEFSIELPTSYKYYFNHDGPLEGRDNEFELKDMVLINSYQDGTLLSIEKYSAKKGAIDAIYESETAGRKDMTKSESDRDGYRLREVVQKSDSSYMVRRYFSSKNQLFILTAGSRTSVTPAMKRFLDSMVFTPGKPQPDPDSSIPFSSLKMDEITVDLKLAPADPPNDSTDPDLVPSKGQTSGDGLLTILAKPRATYTTEARQHQVVGSVVLRLTLTSDGFISHMDVLRGLPDGILRQAMIAAVRIKFLPREKDGKPITIEKILRYNFEIY